MQGEGQHWRGGSVVKSAALSEVLGLVPSTHIQQLTTI